MRIFHLLTKLLPESVRARIQFRVLSKKATLIGRGQYFGTGSGIYLKWGSDARDVVLHENSELFGNILSYNHGKVTLGKWAKVGMGSKINCVNSIEIGEDTAISNFVTIVDHNYHPINPDDRRYMRHTPHLSRERQPMYSANAPIKIGSNVCIGEYSRICKGVTIGDNAIIGACSIVTKSVPANCIAAGNPARVVKEGIDINTTAIFPLEDVGITNTQ
jgi:acetyltransferase-like isoleucine patch superfamily enzyme